MGKMDSNRGQRLILHCGVCHRPLGVFYVQKCVSREPQIEILNGSLHRTEQGTLRIYATCKCGEKTVFENKSPTPVKRGWRRIT